MLKMWQNWTHWCSVLSAAACLSSNSRREKFVDDKFISDDDIFHVYTPSPFHLNCFQALYQFYISYVEAKARWSPWAFFLSILNFTCSISNMKFLNLVKKIFFWFSFMNNWVVKRCVVNILTRGLIAGWECSYSYTVYVFCL